MTAFIPPELLDELNRVCAEQRTQRGGVEADDEILPDGWAYSIAQECYQIVKTQEASVDGSDPFLSEAAVQSIRTSFVTIAALSISLLESLDRQMRELEQEAG